MQLYKQICICLILGLFPTVVSAKIVFLAAPTRAEHASIYVMDDDGSNRTLVYDGKPNIYDVRWSPNGQITFETSGEFYLLNSNATDPRRLTQLTDIKGLIGSFSYSRDGQQIMFMLRERIEQKAVQSVQILNIETRKITKISDFNVAQLDWAPDGKDVLFSVPMLLGGAKLGNSIYIMNASGRNVKELLAPPLGGELDIVRWHPRWSPDGTQFVYTQGEYVWEEREPKKNFHIPKAYRCFIYDKARRTVRRLNIPKNLAATYFSWMDNGKSIIFDGNERELNEPAPSFGNEPPDHIYKYNLQTNELKRLTNMNETIMSADWIDDDVLPVSPRGKKKVTWGMVKQQGSE